MSSDRVSTSTLVLRIFGNLFNSVETAVADLIFGNGHASVIFREENGGEMQELNEMIGKQVVVETVGKKETFGILTSVETLTNGIYGNSYLISIDKEIVIPMHSIYKITLMDRYERDKEGEKDKKEYTEKKKSEIPWYQGPPIGLISNIGL